jgi:hypothetical protein
MNITIRQKNILFVSVFNPRILSEKEKLSVSAVSVRIRSIFIPSGKNTKSVFDMGQFCPAKPTKAWPSWEPGCRQPFSSISLLALAARSSSSFFQSQAVASSRGLLLESCHLPHPLARWRRPVAELPRAHARDDGGGQGQSSPTPTRGSGEWRR